MCAYLPVFPITMTSEMISKDPQYFKQYYLNNRHKMIESARESYKRQKDAMTHCALCDTTVKKLGYTKHCLSKKHVKNKGNLSVSGGDVEEDTDPEDAGDVGDEIIEGVYESDNDKTEEVIESEDSGDAGGGGVVNEPDPTADEDSIVDSGADTVTDVETVVRSTDSNILMEETKVRLLMTISIQQVS